MNQIATVNTYQHHALQAWEIAGLFPGQGEIKVRLDANRVHKEIKDNDFGFDQTCIKPTSLGLRILRERAESIHAELQIASLPGQGTTVNLDWHQ